MHGISMNSLWLDTHPVRHPEVLGAEDLPDGGRFDAVIAGAGLTGLTTAVLLARAGQSVAVIEGRHVGAVATGNTTAKVSLLQGSNLSQIRSRRSDDELRAYVQGNREGMDWLLRYLDENGVDYQRRDSLIYAHGASGETTLDEELRACEVAGIPAERSATHELPFDVAAAVRLPDQAQIHPTVVLDQLVWELIDRGGHVYEGVRLVGAEAGQPVTARTNHGELTAGHLVLATGAPVLDRGGYFAKMKGERSYCVAFRMPSGSRMPRDMYLSVDPPGRSLRTAPAGDDELLLVGGNGHVVGRAESHLGAVDDLVRWTEEHFPGAEPTYRWSAQDYRPADHVPFFGALPGGGDGILVATGYNKWGMTNGVAVALALSARILGGSMPWSETLAERHVSARGAATAVKDNLSIGARMAHDWVSAELHALPGDPPGEGQGVVGRENGVPVGVSTVDGETRKVSAVCPHLGGVLNWNDAECTWDCPLHASRFGPDGAVLEGPAVSGLTAV